MPSHKIILNIFYFILIIISSIKILLNLNFIIDDGHVFFLNLPYLSFDLLIIYILLLIFFIWYKTWFLNSSISFCLTILIINLIGYLQMNYDFYLPSNFIENIYFITLILINICSWIGYKNTYYSKIYFISGIVSSFWLIQELLIYYPLNHHNTFILDEYIRTNYNNTIKLINYIFKMNIDPIILYFSYDTWNNMK